MNTPQPSPAPLLEMAFAHFYAAALHAVTELGIADLLAGSPRTAEELARLAGAHPASLYRVLRALSSKGLFTEDAEGRFQLTPLGQYLRADAPMSMRDTILLTDLEPTREASSRLVHTVKTGETAFDHVHGEAFFTHIRRNPRCGEIFDRGMAKVSAMENPAIVASYDFSRAERIVDVGGGMGGLLALLLAKNPTLRGVLYDRPEALAEARRFVDPSLGDRIELSAGDFFTSVPEGADIYMIKRVLHNWPDDACASILMSCRRAMAEGGRVLVIDGIVPPGNADHPINALDLMMLTLLTGRERTEAELAALFAAAGLKLARVIRTQSPVALLEGVRA